MGKNRESAWATEVQYGEIYEDYENLNLSKDVIGEAFDALNRFYQKEQRRSKHSKRRKECWQ